MCPYLVCSSICLPGRGRGGGVEGAVFSDRNVKLFFRPHNIKMLPLGAKEITGWLRVLLLLQRGPEFSS